MNPRRSDRWVAAVGAVCAAVALASCAPGQDGASPGAGDRSTSTGVPSGAPASAEDSSPVPDDGPTATPTPASPPDPTADAAGRRDRDPSAGRTDLGTGWGPDRREIARAGRMVGRLSLRQLAGQVIVAEYGGTSAPTALVQGLHLGGVIVMADNIVSTDQLRRSNRRLQQAAAEAGRRWPVFVGVDQEGGVVERVKGDATRFPTFMTAGAADRPALTRRAAAGSGAELAGLGFTAVFAPDADVTSGPEDPTIGSRSPGSRPPLVARQATAAVEGHLSAGVLPVVKHFPGHGSVPADSHVELPVQRRSLRQLRRSDLAPFRRGIEAGVPSVMVAHVDVRAVDPGVPSSLSRKVVTGLLRRELGFDGLVVTDALNMRAVSDRYSSATAAVRALRAGNDVVLMPPSPRQARGGIVRAVRDGRLSRARLEQAATRQVALLLHQRGEAATPARRPGESQADSYRLSAAGVTVVSGPCRGRLVGDAVRASGPPEAVARFHAAASSAGLATGSGTSVALVGYAGSPRTADVVVSLDTPYVLGSSTGRTARIALFGDTPGAMRALVDVLLGRAQAPGRLPVRVPGVPRNGC